MKSFVAILALVAVAAADVSHLDAAAQIVSQDADVFPDQYRYEFQTSNGIQAKESGVLKNVGREDEALEVQGSNSYVGNDGQSYSIQYIANENGYQPQGAHLPTPQPIPEYILRALEYIASQPQKVEIKRA
ncbi:cuticle protein CP14.6-like [Danaus plexippus]|uniref:Cuticular protein CPR3 n=1 Tax=Danaus plexippus plexippus TaxID=278856 RepID=A0A212FID0_DANPL|nr:cuticle protein CP14.6-like [Danaus plexippus]OWR53494.1 cuticular protein CPR3 [Danaus plexippus plexippus]